jgi:hypothetical protein
MGEMAEVVQGTIKELLERLDALAAKLGITAEYVWKFTVSARIAEAKRDLLVGFSYLLGPILTWLYAWAIWNSNLPHDGCYHNDLTSGGYALAFTAIVAGIVGFVMLFVGLEQILDGVKEFKTVEYDAFTDLLDDLRG